MKYLGPKTADEDLATQSDVTGGGGASTPAGVVVPFAGSSAPTGYLMCDGATVSRTTYADLFAAIGTTFGAGDGSTTFALPNLKGRVVVGVDAGQTEFDTLGETGGAKTHTLTSTEIPAHTHSDGTLATDTEASHTHSDGTLATDTAADHSHGTGSLATVSDGGHNHFSVLDGGSVKGVVTSASLSFATLNQVRNDSNQTGVVRNLSLSAPTVAAAVTSSAGSHTHTLAGSTGTGGSHSHDVTGSTGSAGSHSHDVTGSTGSTGGGSAHNNLSPYMALSYLIKT